MSRGVSVHDAINCVPVGAVGLISVHHCQVGDHDIHFVLRNLTGKLQTEKREDAHARDNSRVLAL